MTDRLESSMDGSPNDLGRFAYHRDPSSAFGFKAITFRKPASPSSYRIHINNGKSTLPARSLFRSSTDCTFEFGLLPRVANNWPMDIYIVQHGMSEVCRRIRPVSVGARGDSGASLFKQQHSPTGPRIRASLQAIYNLRSRIPFVRLGRSCVGDDDCSLATGRQSGPKDLHLCAP